MKKLASCLVTVVLILVCLPMNSLAAIQNLDVSPLSLNFGTAAQGYNADALSKDIIITNTGSSMLLGPMNATITGASNTAFVITTLTWYPDIPGGESRTFSVKPAANLGEGAYTAFVHIEDKNTGNTEDVALAFVVSAPVVPRTSDASNPWLWLWGMTAALLVSFAAAWQYKKHRRTTSNQ